MKRRNLPILLALMLLCTVLTACKEPDFVSTAIVFKDRSIQEPMNLAEAEFARIFAHLDGLKITGANAAARSDDSNTVVIEIIYESATDSGRYGFLCDTDENGDYCIVSHGENITVELLEG